MRNLAEQGLSFLQMLGNAMYARPDADRTEARRYYRRLFQSVCRSGADVCDPAVYITTEDGQLLAEAGRFYIRQNMRRPDPDQLDGEMTMSEFKKWFGDTVMLAAGAQQLYELESAENGAQGS